jgi:ribosomal protein L11 methylase PrmA
LVDAREVDRGVLGEAAGDAAYVLEHPCINPITYPYEWPFALLRRAACFHLELHLEALEHNATLIDACAYNVQFEGVQPIFIDYLSLRPYRNGEPWIGHRQFLEQFVNPLLLDSCLGIAYQAWYRSAMDGVPSDQLVRLLRWRHRLNWRVLSHLVIPTWLQGRARGWSTRALGRVKERPLTLPAYRALLRDTLAWVKGLRSRAGGNSTWGDYADKRCYSASALAAKRDLVARFAASIRPGQLWDIGCNDGEMAAIALSNGADKAVGLDVDADALDAAVMRAERDGLNLLPLAIDIVNPSPDQGWRAAERSGLGGRARPDALLALALLHHLCIGRNVPLADAVAYIVGLAPCGLLEFVPRTDPMVERMLAVREDVFTGYGEAAFLAALTRRASVVERIPLPECGRVVFWYERK